MKALLLLPLSLLLLVSGCASRYMVDAPYVISPCFVEDQTQARDYAAASLLLTLQERKWVVNKVDKSDYRIVAEGCRHGQNCVSIDARVLPDGTIHVFRNPQPRFGQIDLLKKWMGGLENNYKGRCRSSYEKILTQLQRRGIDYASIKDASVVPASEAADQSDTED